MCLVNYPRLVCVFKLLSVQFEFVGSRLCYEDCLCLDLPSVDVLCV